MSYYGLLALGIFIGAVITISIQKNTNWKNTGSFIMTVIGAISTGGIFTLIEFLGGNELGDALFMYPIGLLLGLMWVFAKSATDNIKSTQKSAWILGVLHLIGIGIISIFVIIILTNI